MGLGGVNSPQQQLWGVNPPQQQQLQEGLWGVTPLSSSRAGIEVPKMVNNQNIFNFSRTSTGMRGQPTRSSTLNASEGG